MNSETEIWKVIEDFPDYEVSNLGRIKSFKQDKINGKISKKYINNRNYKIIYLYKNGKGYSRCIHILVYETFNNYKLKKDECVHHKNKIKENNYLNNLEMMNKKEHIKLHSKNENNGMFGKNHTECVKNKIKKKRGLQKAPNSKLRDEEVWLIKKILDSDYYKSGKITQKFIGKMFDVNFRTISNIKMGKR